MGCLLGSELTEKDSPGSALRQRQQEGIAFSSLWPGFHSANFLCK